MICEHCGCPGADVPFRLWCCPNRGCEAYDRGLRELLDRAVGRWVATFGLHDPRFNGERVSVIAKWLEERKP